MSKEIIKATAELVEKIRNPWSLGGLAIVSVVVVILGALQAETQRYAWLHPDCNRCWSLCHINDSVDDGS